jgi:hypothetical protein
MILPFNHPEIKLATENVEFNNERHEPEKQHRYQELRTCPYVYGIVNSNWEHNQPTVAYFPTFGRL